VLIELFFWLKVCALSDFQVTIETVFKIPELAARWSDQKEKAPTVEKFLGLICWLGHSDLGIGEWRNPFRHGAILLFGGFHFTLGAFGLQKSHQTYRISVCQGGYYWTIEKRKGLISQAFQDSIGRYWIW
jgi:hypothetical protein